MGYELSKHSLVPKHTKLKDTEKEKLFSLYHLSLKELPKISADDPALTKIEVKAGDIVKIERASKTAGVSFYYRVVVDA